MNCILFVDAQNMYKSARDAFFPPDATHPRGPHHSKGQHDPIKLGRLICARSTDVKKEISQVRVYTGRPDSTKQPRPYRAHMRQCARWQKDGIEVIYRQLRYPYDWPNSKPQEKGVDVALALDIVTMAIEGKYDCGIVASTDTDLKPAIEYVCLQLNKGLHIEVMAWYSERRRTRLSIEGAKIWCHYLTIDDYNKCVDPTDYAE